MPRDPRKWKNTTPSNIKECTILFLAANPMNTTPLNLGLEARTIQEELGRSQCGETFQLETRWATEPLDLLRELRKLKPTVVHFSGHGGQNQILPTQAKSNAYRGIEVASKNKSYGLFFQDGAGNAKFVSGEALEATFGVVGDSVKLVVLNACYSEIQATALLNHVDCVVGMSGEIGDETAARFYAGFYRGLGEAASISRSFKEGLYEARGFENKAKLLIRPGVDPDRLFLAYLPEK